MHSYLLDLKFFREEKTGRNKTLLPNQNRNVSEEKLDTKEKAKKKKKPFE